MWAEGVAEEGVRGVGRSGRGGGERRDGRGGMDKRGGEGREWVWGRWEEPVLAFMYQSIAQLI